MMRIYTRTVYEKVSYRAGKSGVCPACGKRATRRQEFWATINPFHNKTRHELHKEVSEEGRAWEAEPVFHARCEP